MVPIRASTARPMSSGETNSSGLWLMPARQRTKIMPMSVRSDHRLTVVAGARHQLARRLAGDLRDRRGDAPCSRGAPCVTGFSWTSLDADPTPAGVPRSAVRPARSRRRRGARLVVGGADVEAELGGARDDVARARRDARPRRRSRPATAAPPRADVLDRQHHLGGSRPARRGGAPSARCRRGRPRRALRRGSGPGWRWR